MPERPLPRSESDALVRDAAAGMPRLLEIMARLRAPDGCPWDIEQTFASIAPYTLEEANERLDEAEKADREGRFKSHEDMLKEVETWWK